jgi:hypothetical protein
MFTNAGWPSNATEDVDHRCTDWIIVKRVERNHFPAMLRVRLSGQVFYMKFDAPHLRFILLAIQGRLPLPLIRRIVLALAWLSARRFLFGASKTSSYIGTCNQNSVSHTCSTRTAPTVSPESQRACDPWLPVPVWKPSILAAG